MKTLTPSADQSDQSHRIKHYWYQNYWSMIAEETERFTLILARKPSTVAWRTCQSSNALLWRKGQSSFQFSSLQRATSLSEAEEQHDGKKKELFFSSSVDAVFFFPSVSLRVLLFKWKERTLICDTLFSLWEKVSPEKSWSWIAMVYESFDSHRSNEIQMYRFESQMYSHQSELDSPIDRRCLLRDVRNCCDEKGRKEILNPLSISIKSIWTRRFFTP